MASISAVHANTSSGSRQNLRLERREFEQSTPRNVPATRRSSREIEVDVVVPGLAGQQAAVQLRQVRVLHRGREQLEPFATAGLDDRRNQQRIDQPLGLVAADFFHQAPRIRAGFLASDHFAPRFDHAQHFFVVSQLFPGQPRQRFVQVTEIRIAEHQPNRQARGLSFAVGVVEQQLAKVGDGLLDPARIGIGGKIQHGGGSLPIVQPIVVRDRPRVEIEWAAVKYRRLGHSGLAVSEIGLGSWLTFGSKLDSQTTRTIARRAFDHGINLFDTADVYADGAAEIELGRALEGLPRRHLVLASKCFFPASDRANDRGLSRKHLVESVDESLRRLRVDYLDLHQCHRWDPNTPIDETVRTYGDLIRQGKLLYWGVSQWTSQQIEQACRSAELHGAYRPVSNQPEYSILSRGLESDVAGTCAREGLSQLVFSPLAQGVLSGKYKGGARADDSRAADSERSGWMRDLLEPDALERVERLSTLAKELKCTMAQLAIAWCLREPNVASAIVGVTRINQLEDNVLASGISIPREVEAQIDQLFPPAAAAPERRV